MKSSRSNYSFKSYIIDMKLSGKTALVTGAAGGIGSAVAQCFAAEGASLILSDCNREGASVVGERIEKKGGGEATVIIADVTLENEVRDLFAEIEDSFSSLDIVVNIAGGDVEPVADVEAIDYECMSRNLDLNLKSCILSCREACRIMKPGRYGRIVNMSSLVYRGGPGQFSYSAAKGGIFSFTRSLAMAMGGYNITVNALAPALVDVPMFSRVLGKERWETMAREAAARYPLQRIAKPEDVAKAALFLASDDAAFITGQILEISGGARL